jgi:hypothetical protein
MNLLRSISTVSIALSTGTFLCACIGSDEPLPPPGEITWTPRGELPEDPPSDVGRLPEGARMLVATSLDTDFFAFTGPPVAGTASFTNAVVWDPFASEAPPFGAGGIGGIDATVGGARYAVTDGDAFVALYTDETGVAYLVLSVFSDMPDGAGGWFQTNVAVFVLASDFAPGATVALDGIDRIAIFAAGPDTSPEPTIFAAAITGSVTFGPGTTTVGGSMNATVAADFAPAESTVGPPPAGVPLAAGAYDLVLDPTPEVICGGTLEGHEAAFAGASLTVIGATGGRVRLAFEADGRLSITGAAIGTAFGAPALLDAVAEPPDTFVAITDLAGAGPDASELAGAYLLVDGAPASAAVATAIGLAYVDPVGDGGCDALFQGTLTAVP